MDQDSSPELVSHVRTQLIELGFMSANSAVGNCQSLFDAGVLDSLRLMELIPRLEAGYGFQVAVDDLGPENFDTIASMSRYLLARRRTQPP
jgi:acyl carrier protein